MVRTYSFLVFSITVICSKELLADTNSFRSMLLVKIDSEQARFEDAAISVRGSVRDEGQGLDNPFAPDPREISLRNLREFNGVFDRERFNTWKEVGHANDKTVSEDSWNGSISRTITYDGTRPKLAITACSGRPLNGLTDDIYLALTIATGVCETDKGTFPQVDNTFLHEFVSKADAIEMEEKRSEDNSGNIYSISYTNQDRESGATTVYKATLEDAPVVHCKAYERSKATSSGQVYIQRCEIAYKMFGEFWLPRRFVRTVSNKAGNVSQVLITNLTEYQSISIENGVSDDAFIATIPKGLKHQNLCENPRKRPAQVVVDSTTAGWSWWYGVLAVACVGLGYSAWRKFKR